MPGTIFLYPKLLKQDEIPVALVKECLRCFSQMLISWRVLGLKCFPGLPCANNGGNHGCSFSRPYHMGEMNL